VHPPSAFLIIDLTSTGAERSGGVDTAVATGDGRVEDGGAEDNSKDGDDDAETSTGDVGVENGTTSPSPTPYFSMVHCWYLKAES